MKESQKIENNFSLTNYTSNFYRLGITYTLDAKQIPTSRIYFQLRNASQSANDTTTEFGTGHKDIHEDLTVTAYPAPKDVCTDFVADELDKIIADLTVMNADMTDEEHADAMASLLLLRDEARYVLSIVLNLSIVRQDTKKSIWGLWNAKTIRDM